MPNFNMDNVNSAMGATSALFENQLEGNVNALKGTDVSNSDMLNLQYQLSKWQLATSLHSNAIKTISEGIKSTISNLR